MSSTFRPLVPTTDFDSRQQTWLRRVQSAIQDAWEREKPHETLQVLHGEPEKLQAGMLVNADGTDWDPGSGAGVYLRSQDNTEWVFLGSADSEVLDSTDSELELQTLIAIQTEQLRQLTKIALILSAVSGIQISDEEVPLQTGQLRQLTNIALILSSMSGISLDDNLELINQ